MKPRLFHRIATELSDPDKLSQAIEERNPARQRSKDLYIAPETELQKSLASLWAEFLKLDRVGLDDNFFELGGHSLLAMQIGFEIRERFNVDFPLEAFLMMPVLRAQAEKIEKMLFEQASESMLEKLLAEIEREQEDAAKSGGTQDEEGPRNFA